MKKFLSILLAVALVLSLGAVAFADPIIDEPAWDVEVLPAEVVVYLRSNQGSWENIWWWDFCREYFKIDFKVTQSTSPSDYKAIAFMGGEMPDLFYQFFFGNSAYVEMGDLNGYLLDLNPYITPELMPNLTRILDSMPGTREMLQTQSGAIYGIGSFGNSEGAIMSFYINQRWLDEANLALPETLEEFEVAMEAFKARGEDVVPIGGDLGNGPRLLANALGWTSQSASYLTSIALYDGQPEFIYGNKEMFPIFMQYMKKWIDNGYFSKNIFASQVSGDEETALKAADKVGVSQNTSMAINADEWTHVKWLTSQWNDTPQVARTTGALTNASFVLDAALADPAMKNKGYDPALLERLIKFGDWHYDYDNYQISHNGPSAEDTEWLLGLKSGWTAIKGDDGRYTFQIAEVTDGDFSSQGDYNNQRVQGIIGGYVGLTYDMWGEANWPINPTQYKNNIDVNSYPYVVDGYPAIYFFSLEDVDTISAKGTAINTYVNEQYAYFLDGTLEINDKNLETYFAQIDALGFQEYQAIYVDYYNNLKGE